MSWTKRRATNLRALWARFINDNDVLTRDLRMNLPALYTHEENIRSAITQYDELARLGVIDMAQAAHMELLIAEHKSPYGAHREIAAKKIISMDYFLLVYVLNTRNIAGHVEGSAATLEYVLDRVSFGDKYEKDMATLHCYNDAARNNRVADILLDIRDTLQGRDEGLLSPFVEGGWYPLGVDYAIALRGELDEAYVVEPEERVVFRDEKWGEDVVPVDTPIMENDRECAIIRGRIPRIEWRTYYDPRGHPTIVRIHGYGRLQRNIRTIIYDPACSQRSKAFGKRHRSS